MNPTRQEPHLPLRIASVADVARGIRQFELVHPDGQPLPPFTAGSHVTVRVPDGQARKYSLCNDPAETHRYVIAVKRDDAGRGGSVSLHECARAGDLLAVSEPDNAFPLADPARRHVFIAGGIGITPIMSMIRGFGELPPAPWKLYYLTRAPEETAFLDELAAPALRAHVVIHHDGGDPGRAFDLWPVLEKPAPGTHVYCCGPRGLMDAVRDMSGHWSPKSIHFESFVDGSAARPEDRPFTVRLARSGLALEVPVGRSMLEVVREAGVEVPSSCESGTCGSCRTTLLEGEADHRDLVLLPEEQATQVMVCVSRAKSSELVIDR